jgi:muconate cycloisomerase
VHVSFGDAARELDLYPVRIARETGFANEHVIVRLETDDGAVGWGEMSDLSHLPMYRFDVEQLTRSLRELVLGLDPRDLNLIERRLLAFYPTKATCTAVPGWSDRPRPRRP